MSTTTTTVTDSSRTAKAIAMNRSNHTKPLRDRILEVVDGRHRFTVRDLRRRLRYRNAQMWNIRRVVRDLIYKGQIEVTDVVDGQYVMRLAA